MHLEIKYIKVTSFILSANAWGLILPIIWIITMLEWTPSRSIWQTGLPFISFTAVIEKDIREIFMQIHHVINNQSQSISKSTRFMKFIDYQSEKKHTPEPDGYIQSRPVVDVASRVCQLINVLSSFTLSHQALITNHLKVSRLWNL